MSKIILCGPSASGKNHLQKTFEDNGFRLGVSYTTRAPRPGEIDGIDYNFLTREEFVGMINYDLWLEYDVVSNNVNGEVIKDYYGTAKSQFEDYNLFIMTPSGIKKIPKEYDNTYVVINLDIDKEVRTNRMNRREGWSKEKTDTRLEWEKKEFHNTKANITIKNSDF